MVVVIARNIPDAVRGKLKLWFIEVAPYVFVSGVKDFCAEKIANYIWEYCDQEESELLIIRDTSKPPYFKVRERGLSADDFIPICGIKLKCKRAEH